MRQDTMVSGTVALTIAAVLNRIVGFAFRAYLVRTVGQEAMGVFQMAYPLYASVMTVATAGISVGVAKLTAEHRQRGDQTGVLSTLKTGSLLALATGAAGMLALALGSRFIAHSLIGEERTYLPLLALAPALPVVSLAGALRGHYQGMRYMYLVATGLIIEQAAHVYASIHLAMRLKAFGVEGMSTGLALGSTVGELFGLLALGAMALLVTRSTKTRTQVSLGPLLSMVLPVAMGRVVLAVTSALHTILIPRSLRYMGYSASEAAVAYGQLTGMAVNVLYIPAVLTFPFASNLLPAMAESMHTQGHTLKKRNFQRGVSFALALGIPCSVLFVTVGKEICQVLFGVPEAGRLLSRMGWVAWMIYLQHITTATLQGLGKPAVPARNAALCTLLSSGCIVAFSRLWPSLGVDATVMAVTVGISSGAVLGLVEVLKEIGGLRATAGSIVRAALAGATALFVTEGVLLVAPAAPLLRLSTALLCIVFSFVPTALALKLHKPFKTVT